MTQSAAIDTIKEMVHSCLPDARIVLFGSRARGDNSGDSDYDLLVISPTSFSRTQKLNYSTRLHKAIVKAVNAPVDLLLYSEDEVITKRELPGHIVRFAVKEGITL